MVSWHKQGEGKQSNNCLPLETMALVPPPMTAPVFVYVISHSNKCWEKPACVQVPDMSLHQTAYLTVF